MRAEITTMGQDRSLTQSKVDLQLAPLDVRALSSWARTVRKRGRKVTESEASCEDGQFQCNGRRAWCSQQKKLLCSQDAESEASEDTMQVAEAADTASQDDTVGSPDAEGE